MARSTVHPGASEAQEWRPTRAVTSWSAKDIKLTTDAHLASECQALPHAFGSMWQARRVLYRDDQDRGGAARGSREPILSFNPRWGSYQPVDLTTHPVPLDVRTLPVTMSGAFVRWNTRWPKDPNGAPPKGPRATVPPSSRDA